MRIQRRRLKKQARLTPIDAAMDSDGAAVPALLKLFQMQAKILVQVTTQQVEAALEEDAQMLAAEGTEPPKKKAKRRNAADHSAQRCRLCAKNQASKRCPNAACGRCCHRGADACLQHGTAEKKPRATLVSRTRAQERRGPAKTDNDFEEVYLREVDRCFQGVMHDAMRDASVPTPVTSL